MPVITNKPLWPLLLLFAASCNTQPVVIGSERGDYTVGDWAFIKKTYYRNKFMKRPDKKMSPAAFEKYRNSKIIKDLKRLEAVGELAARMNIHKNEFYYSFRAREMKARHERAASYLFTSRFGENYRFHQLWQYYKIEAASGHGTVARPLPQAEKLFKRAKTDKVTVFTSADKKITLKDLRVYMTEGRYRQLFSYRGRALQDALRQALQSWMNHRAHDELVETLNADIDTLERLDHNKISDLFIRVKYSIGAKGIYPTDTIEIDFSRQELFDHYHRIFNRLSRLRSVKAQYTVVSDLEKARKIINDMKNGKNFIRLAELYAVEKRFEKTAHPQIIRNDSDSDFRSDSRYNYWQKLILDIAERNIQNPEPYFSPDGVGVINILRIKRDSSNLDFKEYEWYVKNDLRNKLLRKQLKIDIEETVSELKFNIYREKIPRRYTEKSE